MLVLPAGWVMRQPQPWAHAVLASAPRPLPRTLDVPRQGSASVGAAAGGGGGNTGVPSAAWLAAKVAPEALKGDTQLPHLASHCSCEGSASLASLGAAGTGDPHRWHFPTVPSSSPAHR